MFHSSSDLALVRCKFLQTQIQTKIVSNGIIRHPAFEYERLHARYSNTCRYAYVSAESKVGDLEHEIFLGAGVAAHH